MLDFNRNPLVFHEAFAAISSPDSIVPQVEQRAYWDNQTVEVSLQGSQHVRLDWGKYRLRWELNKAIGIERIHEAKEATTDSSPGVARVPMPRVDHAQLIPVTLSLMVLETGFEVAHRTYDLLVLPSRAAQARYGHDVAVITTDGSESAIVRQLNYLVTDHMSVDTHIVVTNRPDNELLAWVRGGGKMLFVSESDNPAFWQHGRRSVSDVNWITSSSWLKPEVYAHLKIDDPLNLPFERVRPRGYIAGLPHEDPMVQDDFLAGQISGWVQRPNIHTVQFSYGYGKVIMTTYALLDALRVGHPDPVGVLMLND